MRIRSAYAVAPVRFPRTYTPPYDAVEFATPEYQVLELKEPSKAWYVRNADVPTELVRVLTMSEFAAGDATEELVDVYATELLAATSSDAAGEVLLIPTLPTELT
jgi:hypothetical protein